MQNFYNVPQIGTRWRYLCINKTGKPLKFRDMNTDNTLSFISSMVSVDPSYKTLVDLINDMDLELKDICLA